MTEDISFVVTEPDGCITRIGISLSPALLHVLACLGGGEVVRKLDLIIANQEKAKMTQQEELDLLKQVDDATTAIGGNVQKVADNVQIISNTASVLSTEIDQLLANSAGAISPEVTTALNNMKTRVAALQSAAQASSDALDNQVPVLQAIATKGSTTPVPILVPAPPAPLVTGQETSPFVDSSTTGQ